MSVLNDYLEELSEQEVQDVRQIKVVRNPVLDSICDKFDHSRELDLTPKKAEPLSNYYSSILNSLKETNYSSKDIRDFSIFLKEYELLSKLHSVKTGLFLSALINASKEENFEIVISHLNDIINHLGFENKKNVIVIGDAGIFFGAQMREGKLIVKGNAKDFSGAGMYAGEIFVEGSLGNFTGTGMRGGKIYIKTTLEGNTGHNSQGGEIHAQEKIKGIDENCKAKIYQKGELVWPK